MRPTEPPLRVELFVRTLAPAGGRPTQEALIGRLQRLVADGTIDDLAVHVTGGRVSPGTAAAETEPGQLLLDRLAAFETWADRTGRSLEPFFQRTDDVETIDGTDCSGIRFPTVAIAAYRADELVAVAPAATGATVESVAERVDALGRGHDPRTMTVGPVE